jgi:heat-inducible transcriptional repressor
VTNAGRTPNPTVAELSGRAREVFRQVVESYLDSGQPVGSKALALRPDGLGLSPASIRSVLHELEVIGLLGSPHTSAGRVPTETGLRLFVDGIMQSAEAGAEERAAIEAGLGAQDRTVEDVLARATTVLAGLSSCAAVVAVPKADRVLRQASFAALTPTRVLAILVADDGTVENRVVDLPNPVGAAALAEAGNFLTARLAGTTLAGAAERLQREIEAERALVDAATRDLIARGIASWSADGSDRDVLIVRGQAHLLDDAAEADLARVRSLLADLDDKAEMLRVLDHARAAGAMKIFIGSENKLFSLSGSSVIAAPYSGGDGRIVGVVGVIGPTRLNYARIVPMVDYTARTLSRLIG